MKAKKEREILVEKADAFYHTGNFFKQALWKRNRNKFAADFLLYIKNEK